MRFEAIMQPDFKLVPPAPGGRNAKRTGHKWPRHRREMHRRVTAGSSNDMPGIHSSYLFEDTVHMYSYNLKDFLL